MNVVGIGTDIVKVKRFIRWNQKSRKQLRRIFSENELQDIFVEPALISQRFATRFAAKEALYKAFCQSYDNFDFPFITFCRYASVEKSDNIAFLVDWEFQNNFGTTKKEKKCFGCGGWI